MKNVIPVIKEIKQLFTKELLLFEFYKYTTDWYYRNEELVICINLQKSYYEQLYFLNVGIWLNEINSTTIYPKENMCHIRIRAERLFASLPDELYPRELFDLNHPVSMEKINNIELFLTDYFGPVVDQLKSIGSLRKLYHEDFFRYSYIEKNARIIIST